MALCEDGIVIDCSQMRAVSTDPEARTARVQGGATAGDLIDVAQKNGLATTTGTVSSVGMTGLTLGGGYGPLMGNYGLVADNLLSAQVVTADGHLVTASAAEHADLFWGLRGGGGNFGVVVSLEYRLHPITTVLSGLLLYPLDQARAVLRHYDEFITSAPDELTIQPGFIQMPDGMPVLFLSPVYCGPLEEGERVLTPLRAFGKPLADQIQPVAYDPRDQTSRRPAPWVVPRRSAGGNAPCTQAFARRGDETASRLSAPCGNHPGDLAVLVRPPPPGGVDASARRGKKRC